VGSHLTVCHDGVAVNAGFEHRNDHEFYLPDYAEENQLLSGFGSAAVRLTRVYP